MIKGMLSKRHLIQGIVFVGLLTALGGCHPNFNGYNAFHSAETPIPEQTYVMDPGSYAGNAYASGGTQPGTSYGTGAKGKHDGDKAHYAAMAALRPQGPVDWTQPNPQDNKPLPAGQGN